MATRYGTSPWIQRCPASRVPTYPRYRGDRTADVVVIGGGLTGCAAALACASAGLNAIVLERDRIGHGRSGRGPGLLSPEPGPSFRDVAAAHGEKTARRIFDTWRRGALDGAALLRRLKVPCDLDPRDTLVVARSEQERGVRQEYDQRRHSGLDLAWLTRRQIQARMRLDAAGGLKTRDAFMLDPYRACLGVAAAAVGRGALCYERSAATKVRFTRTSADVLTQQGRIRTHKVIVATATATEEFTSLRRHLDQRETYVVLTGRMPPAMRRELGDPGVLLRGATVPDYAGWTHDGRLVISGADQAEAPARTRESVLVQRTGELMYEVLRLYPAISGLHPEYGWASGYGQAADGLMYIGAHRNYPHHLFAIGGHAASLTGAFVASRILLRAVQGQPENADEVFGWTR